MLLCVQVDDSLEKWKRNRTVPYDGSYSDNDSEGEENEEDEEDVEGKGEDVVD